MKIGILQAGHLPDELIGSYGDYPDLYARLLENRDLSFEAWPVVDGEFPRSIHDCDGWLITGSKYGAYEPLDWIARLEDFIRQAYAAGVPMVGICFGHQVMAKALGGKVEKFSGGWGVGRSRYRHADGGEFELHAMHQDQVTTPPPGAEVIASSDFCRYAGLSYGDKALSYQPHPEFDAGFMRELIDIRKGKALPEDLAHKAIGDLGGDLDSADFADRIAAFFKHAARIAA